MKYRLGRRNKMALLDENGHQVAIFIDGHERMAQKCCDILNNLEPTYEELKSCNNPNITYCNPPNITYCKKEIDDNFDCNTCKWKM